MTDAPISDVDSLLGVLESGAAASDAEDVDLLAHALQCAALLAGAAPDDEELQVAGLVHDVGTRAVAGSSANARRAGAAAVADLLGERVAWLVGHHDEAKRYLVTTDPDYTSPSERRERRHARGPRRKARRRRASPSRTRRPGSPT